MGCRPHRRRPLQPSQFLCRRAAGATADFCDRPFAPSTLNVQDASNAAPIVIRSDAHGLLTGDIVAIHGVGGNINANTSRQIRVRDADHFELVGSRGNAAFTAGGIIDAPRHAAPAVITAAVNQGTGVQLTVTAHGFVDGDQVTVSSLPGVAAPNNVGFVVRVDDDNFRLGGMRLNAAYAGGACRQGGSCSRGTGPRSRPIVGRGNTGQARDGHLVAIHKAVRRDGELHAGALVDCGGDGGGRGMARASMSAAGESRVAARADQFEVIAPGLAARICRDVLALTVRPTPWMATMSPVRRPCASETE